MSKRRDQVWENLKMDDGSEKILVIDDNNSTRGILSKMLCRLGYEVSSADNGENGLNLFLNNKFDLVITDLNMPGMNGIDLTYCIKEKSPYTLVVLMTGDEKEVILSRIKGTGVDQVIFKPFALAEIDETIQRLLNQ